MVLSRRNPQNISNFLAMTNTYENITMMKAIVVELLASTKKSLIYHLKEKKYIC